MKRLYDDFCEFVLKRADGINLQDDAPKGLIYYELYKTGFLDGIRLMNSRML